MKEDFFKVGYTSYLRKGRIKKTTWTSRFINKIKEHKFWFSLISIIAICIITNLYLVYKFINILEVSLFVY